ncbi:glucosamine-6-phosphate deaminase [Aliidiomarina taiwanensis]|uniref:Glucosamine-6-phosphate deaminase n=1 Tax=Aliidiomarina taiwanensis TaxID=946228 RepID=A0A432WVN3_9GAMM|nr:glucosamine-6-phosphate deaminase [Aliidiomarina taiwanensis]RUO37825.1 glucosamine-6-phosphate deaminase [Aliidiomarina taiwanensis]
MFYVLPNPHAIAEYLSNLLVQKIQENPKLVLGLATGSTMEPIYAAFVVQAKQLGLNLNDIVTFNLDEYIGLAPEHPQSYHHYMQTHLFKPAGIRQEQVSLPSGMCRDVELECVNYSKKIQAAGGLDFQLLGIGTNGHIGFNEPGTPFSSLTHVVDLSENTRRDNGRFFEDKSQVPTQAITMGIEDIMSAKEVVLVATGSHKAEVMAKLFETAIDEDMPASIIKSHDNFKIIVDQAAAELLPAQAEQTRIAC